MSNVGRTGEIADGSTTRPQCMITLWCTTARIECEIGRWCRALVPASIEECGCECCPALHCIGPTVLFFLFSCKLFFGILLVWLHCLLLFNVIVCTRCHFWEGEGLSNCFSCLRFLICEIPMLWLNLGRFNQISINYLSITCTFTNSWEHFLGSGISIDWLIHPSILLFPSYFLFLLWFCFHSFLIFGIYCSYIS